LFVSICERFEGAQNQYKITNESIFLLKHLLNNR
jgi:hypothetical protein